MENFDGLLKFFNILKSSIQSTQIQHFHKCMYLYFQYIFMLTIRFWPCPKCTFIRLYTTLNLKACKINNASGASPSRKKCVTFLRGGGLQKDVHMKFLVDKIDMWRFPCKNAIHLNSGYKLRSTTTNFRKIFVVNEGNGTRTFYKTKYEQKYR